MLYATTRGSRDVVTAHKTIHQDCHTDGGLFVPFRMPTVNPEEILRLAERSYCENVASILNTFFACRLNGYDVELALGNNPMNLKRLSSRLTVMELWHNPGGCTDQSVRAISDLIRWEGKGEAASNWVNIAVRVAFLFAAYGSLLAQRCVQMDIPLDIAVTTGDFATPMACWYARQMGLPIGNIICGCNVNGSVWELLHRGEFDSDDVSVTTKTPDEDVAVPRNLERLIFGTLGERENLRYLQRCRAGSIYIPPEEQQESLRKGMFAAVISDSRLSIIIPGVYRNCGYVLSPYAALAFGSLQDYRATTGENRLALLIADRSPLRDKEFVCRLLRVPETQLWK